KPVPWSTGGVDGGAGVCTGAGPGPAALPESSPDLLPVATTTTATATAVTAAPPMAIIRMLFLLPPRRCGMPWPNDPIGSNSSAGRCGPEGIIAGTAIGDPIAGAWIGASGPESNTAGGPCSRKCGPDGGPGGSSPGATALLEPVAS